MTCGNYPYLGIQNLPVRLAKYTEVPNLDNYYNKTYIDELEDELRGLINDNKPIELLYSQNGLNQRRPGQAIVTFDTPMNYITVDAYYCFNQSDRTGERTITPGNSFSGRINNREIIVSFSENGLTVNAIISDSQLQSDVYFNIKGYGRRQ